MVVADRLAADARSMRSPIGVGVVKSNGVPFDRLDLAGRDQRVVDRRVVVGGDHQLVVEDRAVALAGEVEVAVVGQVDRRRLVGRGDVVDLQLVVVGRACR